jgi:hypothetical protein
MLGNVHPTSQCYIPEQLIPQQRKLHNKPFLFTICHLFNNTTPVNNVTAFLYARWFNQEISSSNLEEIPKIPRKFHDFT